MPDPLIAHIAQTFRELEPPIAGPAGSGLSSLSSHISTTGPKRGEDLKEIAALPMPQKAKKDRILQK